MANKQIKIKFKCRNCQITGTMEIDRKFLEITDDRGRHFSDDLVHLVHDRCPKCGDKLFIIGRHNVIENIPNGLYFCEDCGAMINPLLINPEDNLCEKCD